MTMQSPFSRRKPPRRTEAVALGYDTEEDDAPRILASGKGYIGEKILALAKENKIPIHYDPLLAGALSSLEIDEVIPPELYQVVAEVLAYVYRIREKYKSKFKDQK
ncbi:MAG: EscU/YscU/HrcU family type III secretion system export apparatus switch protein [Chloroflexota bacterium]|jgi:flagellar biosynthesis protein